MNKFYQFLDSLQSVVNVSKLERLAGIPDNTLARHYHWRENGKGYPIPPKQIAPIFAALCGVFGTVQYDGWTVTYDKENYLFFIERPTGEPDKAKEHKDHFTYARRILYKQVEGFADFGEWVEGQEKY